MIRFFSIAVLFSLSLVAVNNIEAKGPGGPGGGSGPKIGYSLTPRSYGLSHNYAYRTYGCGYRNWSYYCWSGDYDCYFYWCPTQCCYFYWYAPGNCFYPVSYLRVYRPTILIQQVPVQGVFPTPVPFQSTIPAQVPNVNPNPAIPPMPPPLVTTTNLPGTNQNVSPIGAAPVSSGLPPTAQ